MLKPLQLTAVTPADTSVSTIYFRDILYNFTAFRFHRCHFSNPPENAKILHFDNKPRKGFCIISLEPVRTPGCPIEHVLIKDPRGFTVYVPSADILNLLLQTDIVNQTIQIPLYYSFDGFIMHLTPVKTK